MLWTGMTIGGPNGAKIAIKIYVSRTAFHLPVACDVTNSSVVNDFDSDFALTMK